MELRNEATSADPSDSQRFPRECIAPLTELDVAITAADIPAVRLLIQSGGVCSTFDVDVHCRVSTPDVALPAASTFEDSTRGRSFLSSPLRTLVGYCDSAAFFGDFGHRMCIRNSSATEAALCALVHTAAAAAARQQPGNTAFIDNFLADFWSTPDNDGCPLLLRAAPFASAKIGVVQANRSITSPLSAPENPGAVTKDTLAETEYITAVADSGTVSPAAAGAVSAAAATATAATAIAEFNASVIVGERELRVAHGSPLFDALLDSGDGVFSGSSPRVLHLRDADGSNLLHALLRGGTAQHTLLLHLMERQEAVTRALLQQADAAGDTPLQAAIMSGQPDALFDLLLMLLRTDTRLHTNIVSAAQRESTKTTYDKYVGDAYSSLTELTVLPKRYYAWWVLAHNLLHTALRAGDVRTFCRLFVLVDCDAAVRSCGPDGAMTLLEALATAPPASDVASEAERVALALYLFACPSFVPSDNYQRGDMGVVNSAQAAGANDLATVLLRVLRARSAALDRVTEGLLVVCRDQKSKNSELDEAAIYSGAFRGALAHALQVSLAHGWAAVDELAVLPVGGPAAVWYDLGTAWAAALRRRGSSGMKTVFVNNVAHNAASPAIAAILSATLGEAFAVVTSGVKSKPAAPARPLSADKRQLFVAYFVEGFFTQAYGVMHTIATSNYVAADSQTGIASAAATTSLTTALAWGGFSAASSALGVLSFAGRELFDWYQGANQRSKARYFCDLFAGMTVPEILRIVIRGAESIATAYRDFLGYIHGAAVPAFATTCVHTIADFMASSGSYETASGPGAHSSDVADVADAFTRAGFTGVTVGSRLGRWMSYYFMEAKMSTANLVHGTDAAAPSIVRRLSNYSFLVPLRRKGARKIAAAGFSTLSAEASGQPGVDVYEMLQGAATLDSSTGALFVRPGTPEHEVLTLRIVVSSEVEAKWKGLTQKLTIRDLTPGSITWSVVSTLLDEVEYEADDGCRTPLRRQSSVARSPLSDVAKSPQFGSPPLASQSSRFTPPSSPVVGGSVAATLAELCSPRTALDVARTALSPKALPSNEYLTACAAAASANAAAECGRPFRAGDMPLHPVTEIRLRWFTSTFVETFFNAHYFAAKALDCGFVQEEKSAASRAATNAAIILPAAAGSTSKAVDATPQQQQAVLTGAAVTSTLLLAASWFGDYVKERRTSLQIKHFHQLFKDFDFREVVVLIEAFAEHISIKFSDPLSRVNAERADGGVFAVAQVAAMRVFEHILREDHRNKATIESLSTYLMRQARNRAFGHVTPPVATEMLPIFAVLEAGLTSIKGIQGDEPGVAWGRTLKFFVGDEWKPQAPAATFVMCGLRTLGPQPRYFGHRGRVSLGFRLGTEAEAVKLGMTDMGAADPLPATRKLPPLAHIERAPPRKDALTLMRAEALRVSSGGGRIGVGSPQASTRNWQQCVLWLHATTGGHIRGAYMEAVRAAGRIGDSVGRGAITISDSGFVYINLDEWQATVGPTVASNMEWRLESSGKESDSDKGSGGGGAVTLLTTAQVWVTLLVPNYARALALLPPTTAAGLWRPHPASAAAHHKKQLLATSATPVVVASPDVVVDDTPLLRHELASSMLELARYAELLAGSSRPRVHNWSPIPPVASCLRLAVLLEPRSCNACAVHARACYLLARAWIAASSSSPPLRVVLLSRTIERPVDLLKHALDILRDRQHMHLAELHGQVALAMSDLLDRTSPLRVELLREAVDANPQLSAVWVELANEPTEAHRRASHLRNAVVADPANVDALMAQLEDGSASGNGVADSMHLAALFDKRVEPRLLAEVVSRVAQQGTPHASVRPRSADDGFTCALARRVLPVTAPEVTAAFRNLAIALLCCVADANADSAAFAYATSIVRQLGGYDVSPPSPFLLLSNSLSGDDVPLALSEIGSSPADALIRYNADALFARSLRSLLPCSAVGDIQVSLPPDVQPFWKAASADGGSIQGGDSWPAQPKLALTSACSLSALTTPVGGHRKVLRVELPLAGTVVWIKEWPDFPGLEAAARLLTRRLFATVFPGFGVLWGMPPSIVITRDGVTPLSVSLEAAGRSMQSMLNFTDAAGVESVGGGAAAPGTADGRRAALPRLDLHTTVAMQLAALLLCSIDGRSDNIIVRSPASHDDAGHVLCFDNDLCLIPPSSSEVGGIRLGSALLCLGEMVEPIPPKVRAAVLAAEADALVREWVADLALYDSRLKAMLQPSDKMFAAAKAKDTYVYVPLTVMMARTVRGRLVTLQKLLRTHHEPTTADALSCLYPGSAPRFREAAEAAARGASLEERIIVAHPHWATVHGALWWRSVDVSQTTSARADTALGALLQQALGRRPTCKEEILAALSPDHVLTILRPLQQCEAGATSAAAGASEGGAQAIIDAILSAEDPNTRVALFEEALASAHDGAAGWNASQWLGAFIRALAQGLFDGVYRLTVDAAGVLNDDQFAALCTQLSGDTNRTSRLRVHNIGNMFAEPHPLVATGLEELSMEGPAAKLTSLAGAIQRIFAPGDPVNGGSDAMAAVAAAMPQGTVAPTEDWSVAKLTATLAGAFGTAGAGAAGAAGAALSSNFFTTAALVAAPLAFTLAGLTLVGTAAYFAVTTAQRPALLLPHVRALHLENMEALEVVLIDAPSLRSVALLALPRLRFVSFTGIKTTLRTLQLDDSTARPPVAQSSAETGSAPVTELLWGHLRADPHRGCTISMAATAASNVPSHVVTRLLRPPLTVLHDASHDCLLVPGDPLPGWVVGARWVHVMPVSMAFVARPNYLVARLLQWRRDGTLQKLAGIPAGAAHVEWSATRLAEVPGVDAAPTAAALLRGLAAPDFSNVRELRLVRAGLIRDSMPALCEVLRRLRCLEVLDIGGNACVDADGALQLRDTLCTHNATTGERTVDRLRVLGLRGAVLDPEGSDALAHIVSMAPCLCTLDLCECGVGDKFSLELASALRDVTTLTGEAGPALRDLRMGGNPISACGILELLRVAVASRVRLAVLEIWGHASWDAAGARAIAALLKEQPLLTDLDISAAPFSSAAEATELPAVAEELLAALPDLVELRCLRMRNMQLSSVGAAALLPLKLVRLPRLSLLDVSGNDLVDAANSDIDPPPILSLLSRVLEGRMDGAAEPGPTLLAGSNRLLGPHSGSENMSCVLLSEPLLARLRVLDLSDNAGGVRGFRTLFGSGARLDALEELVLARNANTSDEAWGVVTKAAEEKIKAGVPLLPVLTHLDLRGTLPRDGAGGKVAASLAAASPRLTSLLLAGNVLGDNGVAAIAGMFPMCLALTVLDLQNCAINSQSSALNLLSAVRRLAPQLACLRLERNASWADPAVAEEHAAVMANASIRNATVGAPAAGR